MPHGEPAVGVLIEPARQSDQAAILRLVAECGLPVDGLVDHLDTAIVARVDNCVVGCAALEVYPDGALLRSVAVAPAHRGNGIGHRLAQSALGTARQAGASSVYLLTTTAEQFFPRFGFSRVAREDVPAGVLRSVEFQSACPTSATVMRRHLHESTSSPWGRS
jgi:amino-acid N-acetyltransferase